MEYGFRKHSEKSKAELLMGFDPCLTFSSLCYRVFDTHIFWHCTLEFCSLLSTIHQVNVWVQDRAWKCPRREGKLSTEMTSRIKTKSDSPGTEIKSITTAIKVWYSLLTRYIIRAWHLFSFTLVKLISRDTTAPDIDTRCVFPMPLVQYCDNSGSHLVRRSYSPPHCSAAAHVGDNKQKCPLVRYCVKNSGLSRILMYVALNPLILQAPSIPSMHNCKFHVSGKQTGSGALIFSLLSRGRLLCCHFIVLSEVCSCFFLFTAQERDFLLEKWIQWTSRSTKKSQENKYIFQSENVVSNRWKGERNLNLTLLLVIFNQTAGRHFSNRREEEFYGQSIII